MNSSRIYKFITQQFHDRLPYIQRNIVNNDCIIIIIHILLCKYTHFKIAYNT